jgi:hypothetical protein
MYNGRRTGQNLQYLNLNVFASAPNQSCYEPSAGGLLELVLRPNLSILASGNLGTPLKARDELAENSRNFAFYESALLGKLDRIPSVVLVVNTSVPMLQYIFLEDSYSPH